MAETPTFESYLAIRNLIYSYCTAMDAGNYEAVAEIFRNGEISSEGSPAVDRGYDAILQRCTAWTRRYDDNGTPHTKHLTTNLILDIDEGGNKAEASSYFVVLQSTDLLPLSPIIAGRYHDSFVRVTGVWRFERRHMEPQLFGDLSQHLLQ
jgi:SnoaL-like domain